MPKTITDQYYKDYGNGNISGLPLPRNAQGQIADIKFVDCAFHPACQSKANLFVNCEFVNCSGAEYLAKASVTVNIPTISLDYQSVKGQYIADHKCGLNCLPWGCAAKNSSFE